MWNPYEFAKKGANVVKEMVFGPSVDKPKVDELELRENDIKLRFQKDSDDLFKKIEGQQALVKQTVGIFKKTFAQFSTVEDTKSSLDQAIAVGGPHMEESNKQFIESVENYNKVYVEEIAAFEILAEFSLAEKRILDLKIEKQTFILSSPEEDAKSSRNLIYKTPSYKALYTYRESLQKQLDKQKIEGKATTFSTTQKIVDAITDCFEKIKSPEEYEDIFNAPEQLKDFIQKLQPNVPKEALSFVNDFASSVVQQIDPTNDPLKVLFNEKKQLITDRETAEKTVNIFAGFLRKEHEAQLASKSINAPQVNLFRKFHQDIQQSKAWEVLNQAVVALEEQQKSLGIYELEQAWDCEEKIQAIKGCLDSIISAHTIEEIDNALERLNTNPVIDVNKWNINKVTDTRQQVFNFSMAIGALKNSMNLEALVLEREQARDKQGINLFDENQMLERLSIPEALKENSELIEKRAEILGLMKELIEKGKEGEFAEQYKKILEKIESLDTFIVNAQKKAFEENQKPPEERGVLQRVYRSAGVVAKEAGKIGALFLKSMVVNEKIPSKTEVEVIPEKKGKEVFEQNFEGLSNDEKTWLHNNYDELYKNAKEDIFGKGGFLEELKNNARYFYNRKKDRVGGKAEDEAYVRLTAAIEYFETMRDSNVVHSALIERLKLNQGEFGTIQDNGNDPLKNKQFYSSFCFQNLSIGPNSLSTFMDDLKMAPNDPENVFRFRIDSGGRVMLQSVITLGGAVSGLFLGGKLGSLVSMVFPGTDFLGATLGSAAGIVGTIQILQDLSTQGYTKSRNIPGVPPKSFSEWFVEKNSTLLEGLKKHPEITPPKAIFVPDIEPEPSLVKTENIKEHAPDLNVAKSKFEENLNVLGLNPEEKTFLLKEYETLYRVVLKREQEFKENVESTLSVFETQGGALAKAPPAEKAKFIDKMAQCQTFTTGFFNDFEADSNKAAEIINQALLARIQACKDRNTPLTVESLGDKGAHHLWLFKNVLGQGDQTFQSVMSDVKMLTTNLENQIQKPKYPIFQVMRYGGAGLGGLAVLIGLGIILSAGVGAASIVGTVLIGGLVSVVGIGFVAGVFGLLPKGPSLTELAGKAAGFYSGIINFFTQTKTVCLNKTCADSFLEVDKPLFDTLYPEKATAEKVQSGGGWSTGYIVGKMREQFVGQQQEVVQEKVTINQPIEENKESVVRAGEFPGNFYNKQNENKNIEVVEENKDNQFQPK